jgi:hypothetical protein
MSNTNKICKNEHCIPIKIRLFVHLHHLHTQGKSLQIKAINNLNLFE